MCVYIYACVYTHNLYGVHFQNKKNIQKRDSKKWTTILEYKSAYAVLNGPYC